jgi:Flp pilus assembly protein TadD
MKTKLLPALVAALSLNAVGCDDRSPKTQRAPEPRVVLRSAPKVEGPLVRAPVVKAVQAEPEPPTVPAELLALEHEDTREVDHLARASVLREQGDFAGALAEARRAVFDAPLDIDAVEAVDAAARAAGNRAIRLLALDQVAQLRPLDPTPLVQKARVQLALGDCAGAIRTGNEAVLRDAAHPEVYQAMGRAHLSLGQLAPAIALFQKVVQLDPNHGHALNNLGFAYLRANRDREAVDALSRAAELLPKVAYVHNNLGVALERLGRIDEARRAYLEASFLSPKYVKAQVNIARVVRSGAVPGPTPDSVTDTAYEAMDHED